MLHPTAGQQVLQYYSDDTLPEILRTFLASLGKACEDPNVKRIIEPLWPSHKSTPTVFPNDPASLALPPELNILLENSKMVLFSFDARQMKIVNISSACKNMYGYQPEEFYNNVNLWKETIHPDDIYIREFLEMHLKKNHPIVSQYRIIDKDGNTRWIESKFVPILDKNGMLLKFEGITIDRTDSYLREKRMFDNEQKLIESEKRYRAIFENNPQPMWVLDNSTLKLLDVNKAASRHYGYSRHEFLLMSAYDLRTPSERERLKYLEKTYPDRINNIGMWELFSKNGAIRIVEITAELIDFEGKSARLILSQDVTERVNAEKKLKLSNERYELVTRATNDAIWDWNLCKNELYWSEGYEKMFGYRNEELDVNVHKWSSRIHPEDVQRVTDGLMQKINDSDTDFWEDEYRYIKADGSEAFIYDRGFIIYENGTPVRMVGAMQDITRRKNTEEFLYKSEANLRNLLENTDTAYILLDEQAKIVSLNKPARELGKKGIIAAVSEGECYSDCVSAPRKEEVKKAIERIEQTGKPVSYELCHRPTPDTSYWLHVSIHPVLNKEQVLMGFSVGINNITERKISEQMLKESEANLRTIFENTHQSYIFLDKEFKIVSFNQRAYSGIECEVGKQLIVGKRFQEYMRDKEFPVMKDRLETVLGGKKVKYEKCFLQKDGYDHWYELNMFPVQEGNGGILGIIIIAEDITNRKKIELEKERITSELLLRNKTLEQFAYIISHNLRSPVANITGLANIILDSPAMGEKDYQRCMEGLALSVKKLDDVIIDLNFILQVRRKINEKKETVKFDELITDIKTSIASLISSEGVIIATDFSKAEELKSIKSYLNSIFYNLIVNSIKYRDPTRQSLIEINSRKNGDQLILTFRDNGLGIDLNAHGEKIFGLYKRFHNHIAGKGMGLYMVKTQVEMLEGRIDVTSTVDQGTEFRIEFIH